VQSVAEAVAQTFDNEADAEAANAEAAAVIAANQATAAENASSMEDA